MRLAELANINTGLVTARKQAKITDQEIIKYRTLNLKVINEKDILKTIWLKSLRRMRELSRFI